MRRLALKRLEYRNPILIVLIAFVAALIVPLAVTSGSPGSRASLSHGSVTTFQEAKQADVRELRLGEPIERELAGGEAHSYHTSLTVGQCLHVVVEQKGIDVVLKTYGPGGQKLTGIDNYLTAGSDSVFVVAEASGNYRVEVRSLNKGAKTGRYEIRIRELRDATSKDQVRTAAQKAFEEANQLRDQQTADSQRKAIDKYKESLPLWRTLDDRERETRALIEIGVIYSRIGEPQNAMEFYDQALKLSRSIGSLRLEGETLNDIGMSYWRRGQSEKALEYATQALPLRRAVRDHEGEAITLNNIGLAYTALGQLPEALKHYNETLPLSQALGDVRLETIVLNNIGSIYQRLGEYQTALEYFHRVLPLKRTLGDRRSEANTLHNMGIIYVELGDFPKALEHYNQAIALSREVGDRPGEAVTLDNLGLVYVKLGHHEKGLEYYNQALTLARAVRDRRQEAQILTHIGSAFQFADVPQKALDYLNQGLSINRELGERLGEARSLSIIGSTYSGLDQPKKALEYYLDALRLHRAVGSQAGEALTLYGIGRAERQQGNFNEARARIEAALSIIESVRGKVASQGLRSSYLASKQNIYDFYIDLLMEAHKNQPSFGYDAEALQASERARARGLLELLTEAHTDIRQGVDPGLLELERSLEQRLNAKSERLTRLLSGKHSEDQETSGRKELDDLLTDYQDVKTQIRARSSRYAALTQPQPLGLNEIQQILDEDTLLLEYALGEERSYLWAVTPTSVKSFELPGRTEIETATRRVYELLVSKADTLYPEAMTSLSQTLLGPVADQLGRKRLLIVGQGALQYVPFGALPEPSPQGKRIRTKGSRMSKHISFQALVVNHEIVSLASASVMAVLRREMSMRAAAPNKVVVLADPVFGKDDQRVKSGIKNHQVDGLKGIGKEVTHNFPSSDVERSASDLNLTSFDRLPVSRSEAEIIAAMAPGAQSLKALDFAASRATAKSPELGRYQIVHFATHSLLNNVHPELSGIVLSLVDEQGQPQDGFLRLHEIYNLTLGADLVVLSACQTALGKEIKGEGLVGLTRGFMYAGTPRVVASLWKVSDKATAELMKRFYQKMLKEGLRPAAALRAAQVSMSREKQWAAPYYWAGFVLQGEWR